MNSTKRLVFLLTTALLVITGPFLFGIHYRSIKSASLDIVGSSSSSSPISLEESILSSAQSTHKLHFLVPATNANINFCRLLLSAAVTGYPEPILIGWEGKGVYNGTNSHLFKITETLAYLNSLPPSADKDLVLLVDGYDIWLQLRPDVMLSRYAKVIAENDERVKSYGILGKETEEGTAVRNTIVFNPDKVHFPQNRNQPAVWAAPESPLPNKAFGPKTDTDIHTIRPRYLNSGTIMGPVKDVRDMFAATLEMLNLKFDKSLAKPHSDQYYFAEVWGEQEINRRKLQFGDEYAEKPKAKNEGIVIPEIPSGKRTEFHICLDYGSELFQAATGWERSLAWLRWNDSTPLPKEGTEVWSEKQMKTWTFPQDIARSEAPFAAMEDPDADSWEGVMLGTNTVSRSPFPLFHITGNKKVRDWWWPRMWWHPFGEELLRATRKRETEWRGKPGMKEDGWDFARVNGMPWTAAVPVQAEKRVDTGGKGGSWDAESGKWVPWNSMCEVHEPVLYLEKEPAKEGAD